MFNLMSHLSLRLQSGNYDYEIFVYISHVFRACYLFSHHILLLHLTTQMQIMNSLRKFLRSSLNSVMGL
jgi:hypothetical protein